MRNSNQARKPGRPATLQGGRVSQVYLDDKTRATLKALGHGNLSEGIRRAAEIADDKFSSQKAH